MAVTTILEITTMQDEQGGKALNHNTAIQKLEQALGKSFSLQFGNVATFDFSTSGSPGTADALAAYRINITSSATMTQICVVTFPANTKPYLVRNNTTGGFAIKVKAEGGTIETTIANGESAYLYCNGSEMQKVGSVQTAGASNPIFGDGSDGDATLVASASPWSRDMFYNRLLITGASTSIRTTNWRIFVKEYFQLDATCSLQNNGSNASVTTGGAALATGSVGGTPVAGVNGGTGAGGNGNAVTGSGIGVPGSGSAAGGGNGGAGSGGAGGTGGTRTPVTAVQGSLRYMRYAIDGRTPSTTALINVNTGASGGGGGGDGTAGGGSGGPGGYVMLCARYIVNNGTISALGGTGGTPAGGNRGGGGGGQGGIVVLVYQYLSGSGTTSVAGGAGGALTGTGANGTAGQAGQVYTFCIA